MVRIIFWFCSPSSGGGEVFSYGDAEQDLAGRVGQKSLFMVESLANYDGTKASISYLVVAKRKRRIKVNKVGI